MMCLVHTQHGVFPTVVYSTANGRVSSFILCVFVAVTTYLTIVPPRQFAPIPQHCHGIQLQIELMIRGDIRVHVHHISNPTPHSYMPIRPHNIMHRTLQAADPFTTAFAIAHCQVVELPWMLGNVDRVLRVLCVLEGGKKQNKEKKEKNKHTTEDRSKAKPESRKEEKREERKREAKLKKKDPKGKARRIVADDDAPNEVHKIRAEPARMASQPRRAPCSTHLEVLDEPLSPCGSASNSSSKSGSSKSSTSSSSGSSSSSSESDESAEKSPLLEKGVLKAATTEALEKGKDKARPHFLVDTHGRPPSKLPTGHTRREKFTGSAHHVRSNEILESFFSNEYGYSQGTFVHHYKNCRGQQKAATAAQGMCVHHVRSAVHGGSPCVPRDRRSCCARRIRRARRLRMCPWRPSCR